MVVQAGESVGERGLGDRALRRHHQRSLGRRDIAGELVVEGLRPDDELVPADGDRVGGERLAERAAGEPGRQLQCALSPCSGANAST
jgi:hypothetical protein